MIIVVTVIEVILYIGEGTNSKVGGVGVLLLEVVMSGKRKGESERSGNDKSGYSYKKIIERINMNK